jgi:hypothetical protein
MLESIKHSNVRTRLLMIAAGLVLLFLGYQLWSSFGAAGPGADTSLRWFVCSETRKPFQKRIELDMTIPVVSPHSGKETGYPAELCFWNKDGTARTSDPTPVLLETYAGGNGPTFCPECNRLVIGHNPPPDPNRRPPTREEWDAHRNQNAAH